MGDTSRTPVSLLARLRHEPGDPVVGREFAARLGLAVGLVLKARSNVRKLLREEIRHLKRLDIS